MSSEDKLDKIVKLNDKVLKTCAKHNEDNVSEIITLEKHISSFDNVAQYASDSNMTTPTMVLVNLLIKKEQQYLADKVNSLTDPVSDILQLLNRLAEIFDN